VTPNPLDPSTPKRTRDRSPLTLRYFQAEIVGTQLARLRSKGGTGLSLVKEYGGDVEGIRLGNNELDIVSYLESVSALPAPSPLGLLGVRSAPPPPPSSSSAPLSAASDIVYAPTYILGDGPEGQAGNSSLLATSEVSTRPCHALSVYPIRPAPP
jgi:hypothetical protein